MSFKAEIKAAIGWSWNQGALDSSRLDYAAQLSEGHGDGQAEAVWHVEQETLLNGAAELLDITALRRSVLGAIHTATLLSVKGLLVINDAASSGNLVIGGAGGSEWSAPFGGDGDTVALPPDGVLFLSSRGQGWPVDDANKLLKLTAAGGDVGYSVAIIGTLTASGSGSSGN
jgi:hypothetical protein